MHSKCLKLRGKESIKCFKTQNTTELFPGNPCAAVFTGKCIYCKKPDKPKIHAERKKNICTQILTTVEEMLCLNLLILS